MSTQMMLLLGIAVAVGGSAIFYKVYKPKKHSVAVIVGPPDPPAPGGG
jgi:hypothetical protein